MKAAIFQGPRQFTAGELDLPAPGERDVLVRNLYAGICGSAAAAAVHEAEAGGGFGREVIAEVVAKGDAVEGVAVGDRIHPVTSSRSAPASPALSEFTLLPAAKSGEQFYPVSRQIPVKAATLIEPFLVGAHAAGRGEPENDDTAVVFGAGRVGIATAIALKRFGCSQVMVVDRSDLRLQLAAKLGFATCHTGLEDLASKAIEVFGTARSASGITADVDIFVDAAGDDAVIRTYQAMGRVFSRMVVVGIRPRPLPVDLTELWSAHQEIVGSDGAGPQDVDFVLKGMQSPEFDVESLVTHEFPLGELATALEVASDPHVALAVAIKF
ncbi:zinc-binding dehydrogenase [Cryptosporangium sp. NPDC048952]|uniref:zinc-dependent alcohol dehydrogenase n=1 Tax=Cryptosporangium sp. NPDC048952 TaxID=3363961 RepID=UPI00371E428B